MRSWPSPGVFFDTGEQDHWGEVQLAHRFYSCPSVPSGIVGWFSLVLDGCPWSLDLRCSLTTFRGFLFFPSAGSGEDASLLHWLAFFGGSFSRWPRHFDFKKHLFSSSCKCVLVDGILEFVLLWFTVSMLNGGRQRVAIYSIVVKLFTWVGLAPSSVHRFPAFVVSVVFGQSLVSPGC